MAPVDGKVVEGRCTVDGSSHRRVHRCREGPDSHVTVGTLTKTGSVVMRADRVGADTLLAQIV